jgi:hypothetical protein
LQVPVTRVTCRDPGHGNCCLCHRGAHNKAGTYEAGLLNGVEMERARKERLKAYGLLVVFVALVMAYGRTAARLVRDTLDTSAPAAPLIIGAVVISLLTVAPLLVTFRASAAAELLEKMREKARRSGKSVTIQSAARSLSMYVVALAATPVLYGLALIYLIGEFKVMLLLLPATVILAVVGWFVVGRLLREMRTMFVQ